MTDYFSKAPHLHDCKIGPHHDECTCGLEAVRAEIEQLTKAHDTVCGALAKEISRAEKAEAEIERLTVERDFFLSEVKLRNRIPSTNDTAADLLRRAEKAEAKIERLNNALTEAVNQISDLATRLGQAEGRLDASELVGVVEGWKARAEKAEAERDANAKWLGELLAVIHRDGGHYQSQHGDEKAVAEAHRIWARLITERDEARAEIERLRPMVIDWDGVRVIMDSDGVNWVHGYDYASSVKERDEALAQVAAALEAYGREKMKEETKRAADIVEDYCADDPFLAGHGYSASIRDDILSEMEALK